MKRFFILAILSTVLVGCGATVPHYEVWRPWTRVLADDQAIRIGQSIKIEVQGETVPLLGKEDLLQDQLVSLVSGLLTRRGYIVSESEPDLVLSLTYRTERVSEFAAYSYQYSTGYTHTSVASGTASGGTGYTGLGVSIAAAVSDVLSLSRSASGQALESKSGYFHSIALDISSSIGSLVWKGESTWYTESIEITDDVGTAIQWILSKIPNDPSVIPSVPALKGSHVQNYLDICCMDSWFSCPSLPYRILFGRQDRYGSYRFYAPESPYLENEIALPAYVDLAHTAEFAVPEGEQDYSDPLNLDLWKRVTLGGRYLLGPHREKINVLLRLEGRDYGYIVKKAWLASDAEYAEFEGRLKRWQEALRTYFDMFEE